MLYTRTMYSNDATIRTSHGASKTDVWVTQSNLTVATDAKVANPSAKALAYTSPVDIIPSDTGGILSCVKPATASPNPGVSANPNESWFLHKTTKTQDFGLISSNNAVRFTSQAGNDVWVQFLNSGASKTLSAAGSGRTVTVTLGTNSSGAITSTGSQVIAAVNGSGSAAALATAANAGASTGAGIVTAQPLTEITRLLHGTNWLMNVGSAGLRTATLANMLAKNTSGQPFDGCFLDNLFTDLRGFAGCVEYSNAVGTFPNPWQTAYMGWLDALVPQLHANGVGIVIGNVSTTAYAFNVVNGDFTSGSTIWNAYMGSANGIAAPTLERCDGGMWEGWGDGTLGPQQQQVNNPGADDCEIAIGKYNQANGKYLLAHSYLTRRLGPAGATLNAQTDQTVRRFALVQTLICGDPRAVQGVCMMGLNAGTTDANSPFYTEQDQALTLGAPSGPATRDGTGAYTRSFANGSVIWNPTNAVFSGVPAWDSSLTLTANPVPVNSVAPVATGTTNVGDTLTTTSGTWTNSPTSFAYQWQRAGVNIGAATASTYQIVSADVGNAIRCNVTATNSGGASSPASSNAITIPVAAPTNTVAPVASGSTTIGSTLTTTNGTWTGSPSFTYQWQRNGVNIVAATATTYVLVTADAGATVWCNVTGTNAGGSAVQASNGISIPVAVPICTVSGVASGTPTVGQTLSATNGTWTGSPTFAYQWQRNGVNIAGATANTYLLVSADAGTTVWCSVFGTNAGGTSASNTNGLAISAPLGVPANTVAPAVTGTTTVGSTLTTTNGTWTNSPTAFTYSWQRDGSTIGAPNTATYTIVSGDISHTISCLVTASNATGASTALSNGTAIPNPVSPPANTVAPVVSGTANVGQALSTTNGTWTNTPTSFSYSWLQDGVPIGAPNVNAYTIVLADAGHTISCLVTATNSGGSATAVSNGIGIPAAVPTTNTTPPFVSGQLYPGGIISGTAGVWAGVPAPTFTYQWQRDAGNGFIPMPGQNGPAYQVQRTDLGARLTLVVTATNVVSVSQAASNSLRLITRRILIDQNGQISDSEIPPPVLRDLNPTPVLIDTTGITNGQVLIYNAATNTMKPGAN